ncbi:TrmH family RNA methyltransferase [Sphingomonas sp. CFBP 13720]|uniref:TrmH family RNA methyltransferase n=1 Tax=Sphingomonas sp. CFBP 13720 TaxID=2775302 RepID=UPI0017800A00|nr:TrmH family RNA methyltransferase [Sphingomonas sp. CFBP 13720]MBD8678223.1 GIY-YIG nuclease family protein [Sphingomonas sp. CFBP 13720]
MSFAAYILRCSDGKYYVGHTDDLERRVAQHQAGEIEGFTQARRPIALAWSETVPTREQAQAIEQQLKGWSRAKKEALIAGDWDTAQALARKSFDTGLRRAQPLLRTDGVEMDERGPQSPPPVIVLVRPQLGQNIGKAARAMLNFGLTELRLVAPRDGWPNPEAGPAASGADRVLRDAVVYDSVAEAVADCAHVYATTVRKRGITKPVVTPEAAAGAIRSEPGRSAILFGPERSGLETDDVALARTILTVPINPEFGSLNLAQAVILVAYEWSKGEGLASPPTVDLGIPAPHDELEGMIRQLDEMLEAARFFFPPERATTSRRTLRTLLTKPGWTSQEVRTMRGVLSALDGAKRRR